MENKFNSKADMPDTIQFKYDIIFNFIEHWTSDDDERRRMHNCLWEYINYNCSDEMKEFMVAYLQMEKNMIIRQLKLASEIIETSVDHLNYLQS